jgi:HEPN domain-containing protein
MINIKKQITYWRKSAEEDWSVGQTLVSSGKIRHGLFFIHLALEKILKANMCRTTQDLAPKIHSLVRLAEQTQMAISEAHMDFLAEFDRFDIAGRYPHEDNGCLEQADAEARVAKAQEVFQWLSEQL